ncbi:ABC-three component system middle component 2 [Terrisporobacter mayombei]|uniref:Uncharacterized protein n=1 Tax=Terrisporobacter mayombei TaxID=1541 RepID=A0ABY9Q0G5_9FIRM|nr:ABC-three component system middle component 2 [Terrisporobacter mayombei]MCC3867948.1 hypothetical protein [Terrisporobacter mayombei]WMT80082.1 hypothetical protein TEMA_03940 [Terrisporobacter mayombei]
MHNIFNSTFESSLRVLLILNEYDNNFLTSDMIANIDFICIYGETFKISENNLQGDNNFKFSQLPKIRKQVDQGLRTLICKRLAIIKFSDKGFTYKITEKGIEYCHTFTSDYANKFRELACKSQKFVTNKSDRDVLNMIRECCISSFSKEDK